MPAPLPSQPPEAVLDALREAGLEPSESVLSHGGGHVWCATSVEGVRFRVRAVPAALAGSARARALRLAAQALPYPPGVGVNTVTASPASITV